MGLLEIFIGIGLYLVLTNEENNAAIGKMNAYRFIPVFKRLPHEEGGTKYNINFAKDKSGIYIIKENGKIVYIGHSTYNLYKTIVRHFQSWNDPRQRRVTYVNSLRRNRYTIRIVYASPTKAYKLEQALIRKYKPRDNFQKLEFFELEEKEVAKLKKQDKKVVAEYEDTDLGYPPEWDF